MPIATCVFTNALNFQNNVGTRKGEVAVVSREPWMVGFHTVQLEGVLKAPGSFEGS